MSQPCNMSHFEKIENSGMTCAVKTDDWKTELIKIMMDERELGNLDKSDEELMDY